MTEPLLIARHADTDLCLLPALANRHGLITGATGTGKTVTLRVLAEGIEHEDVRKRLAEYGCRYFQGYLFGRPMAPPADPGALAARR